MERYKICPSCGEKNSPALFECQKCEADLSRVRVTSDEDEQIKKEQAAPKPEKAEQVAVPADKAVRVCECGEKNPPNARKCQKCGEDISDILPTEDTGTEVREACNELPILQSCDGKFAYELKVGDVVVGREATMSSYLSAKAFVSRKQCRISYNGKAVHIENLSKTNFTYVNNEKISGKVRLFDGDEIEFGGLSNNGYQSNAAYFVLRLPKCT